MIFKSLLKIFSLFFLGLVVFCFLVFFYYAKDLPNPEKFTEREFYQTSKIYDRTGKVLLYSIYGEEKRTIVPLEKIPDYLKKAVIAAEDANFYKHKGIDWQGILRAILLDLRLRKPIYGGSTISQQLIRSSFLTQKKTLKRKIREIILAIELERKYPKEKILYWYLNQVPFGSNAYGVEAASQTFFGKSVSEITLAEAATLAALIKAPSYLSPYGPNLAKLMKRKDYVLDRMVEENFISKKEAQKAKKQKIVFKKILNPIKAPHFTLQVKEILEKEYGREFLQTKGLKIYTTLDWELQKKAESLLKKRAKENEKYRAFNAALVILDPKKGEILALVGSKDWFSKPYPENCLPGKNCLFDPKVNAALSLRQPGSAFKPIVYAKAFEKGYSDKTIVIDKKTNFGIWGGKPYIPQNYDGKFRGPVTLREALAQSLNVPSVKVLANFAGLKESIELAKKMGITSLEKPPSFYGLSLVLGGGEVRLLDLVSAYSVFANEGKRVKPHFIKKIVDREGKIIKENNFKPKKILSPKTAKLITDILSDNQARAPMFGFNSPLKIQEFQAAVKTGTTENFRDAWTIGYTDSLVVGVWVGNNDNSPTLQKPGVVLAAPLWRDLIVEASLKYPPQNFQKSTQKNMDFF